MKSELCTVSDTYKLYLLQTIAECFNSAESQNKKKVLNGT